MIHPDGVLLDMDGVLAISWHPIPGAADTLSWLRTHEIPFRIITNTTTQTRRTLSGTLREAGLEVAEQEIVTAVVATATYLREHHPGAAVYVLSDGDASEDLEDVRLVEVDDAEVVVLGGACDDFTYDAMGRIFRRLMDGASLVGMHRNMYWKTRRGLELDAGAYVAGLEAAANVSATICGKPAPAFFEAVRSSLGVDADRAVMVGDDIVNDVLGAQATGITGVQVRTGKFTDRDLERGAPDHVIDSIADLPALLGSS